MTVANAIPAASLAMLLAASGTVMAQACPAAGARYVIKGFTGDTAVTATGGENDRQVGCKWQTDDGRELWWKPGSDVVPADGADPVSSAPGPRAGAGGGDALTAGNVYECTLPGIGLFTGAYFGIVDDDTYRNFDGEQGDYRFDATSGVLELISGSSAGLSYRRTPEGTFRVLDEAGAITGGNCVHNSARRIDGRW